VAKYQVDSVSLHPRVYIYGDLLCCLAITA
jgi:hypothetical protein